MLELPHLGRSGRVLAHRHLRPSKGGAERGFHWHRHDVCRCCTRALGHTHTPHRASRRSSC